MFAIIDQVPDVVAAAGITVGGSYVRNRPDVKTWKQSASPYLIVSTPSQARRGVGLTPAGTELGLGLDHRELIYSIPASLFWPSQAGNPTPDEDAWNALLDIEQAFADTGDPNDPSSRLNLPVTMFGTCQLANLADLGLNEAVFASIPPMLEATFTVVAYEILLNNPA